MKRSEIFFSALRVPVDFFMVFFSLFSAYLFRVNEDHFFGIFKFNISDDIMLLSEFVRFSIFASIAFVLLATFFKLYAIRTDSILKKELTDSITISIVWLMFLISYFFVMRGFFFSRFVLVFAFLLIIILVPLGRILVRFAQFILLSSGIGRRKVLIIGVGKTAQELFEVLKKDKKFEIVGAIKEKKEEGKIKKLKNLGESKDLEDLKGKFMIDEVFQAEESKSTFEIIQTCKNLHIKYHFVPDVLEIQRMNIMIHNFSGIPVIELRPTPLEGWNRIIKRAFDIFFSFVFLLILSPIFIIIAIIIKIDSKGPVFFSKLPNGKPVYRVGQKGKKIKFYKFRTMKKDAHAELEKIMKDRNTRQEGPLFKAKNDPRITRVGKFLRMSSLDELPQLFSVLMSDLSLVGPRPHTPEEVARYQKKNKRVLETKPGITGLAQVSGRHNLKFEEENRLDLFYIENWSIFLDIKIILKTILVVMSDIINKREN